MSEAKHTPGPWSIHPHAHTAVVGGTEFVVAACGGHSNSQRDIDELDCELTANARLIAAAPDLLAACKLALDCNPCGGCEIALRKAVEKAEGKA